MSQAIALHISEGFRPIESDSEVKIGEIWRDPAPPPALIEHLGPIMSILAIFWAFRAYQGGTMLFLHVNRLI